MFTRAITHQKHLAQSGRSTQSTVDIFNTLRVFTREPIREQERKLECMKNGQWAESIKKLFCVSPIHHGYDRIQPTIHCAQHTLQNSIQILTAHEGDGSNYFPEVLWRPLLFSRGPKAQGKIVAVSRAPRGNRFNHPPNIKQSIFVL